MKKVPVYDLDTDPDPRHCCKAPILQVNVTVYDDSTCVTNYAAVIAINPKTQFCAGRTIVVIFLQISARRRAGW
jgi:hypothetical protein